MSHKNVTVNKVVSDPKHSVVTPEHLSWTLNIGLDKSNQMLRVTAVGNIPGGYIYGFTLPINIVTTTPLP